MDSQERNVRRLEQIDEIYRELGRFIVEWSQLMFWLRTHLSGGFQGVPGSFALVAHLDDRELIEAFDAVSAAWLKHRIEQGVRREVSDGTVEVVREFNDEGDTEIAKTLRKWLHRLHDERNRMVHDAWFVGWGNDATIDWSEAELLRVQAEAEPGFDQRLLSGARLRSLSDETRDAALVVARFAMRRRFGLNTPLPRWEIRGHRVILDWGENGS